MIEFNLKNIVRKNIWNLKPYSSARNEFDLYNSSKNALTLLDANENPNGHLNRYPDPLQVNIKEMLSLQKGISKDQIFIGNGSDEAIDLLYRIFCIPKKDSVVTCPPTYGMYGVSAAINNIEVLKIPLKENFDLDLEKISACIKNQQPKLLWICSPNNPTGNELTRIQNFEDLLRSFNGIVVIDEAYIDFTDTKSWLSRLSEFPNLVILQTMSKAYGLAGARVGFAFASPAIINLFNKIKPPYNVNELSQQVVLKTLQSKTQSDQQIKQLNENRDFLIEKIACFDIVEKIYPSKANFILIKVKNAHKVYTYMIDSGIIIRNRNNQIENTLRITIGTRKECEEVIRLLKNLKTKSIN